MLFDIFMFKVSFKCIALFSELTKVLPKEFLPVSLELSVAIMRKSSAYWKVSTFPEDVLCNDNVYRLKSRVL